MYRRILELYINKYSEIRLEGNLVGGGWGKMPPKMLKNFQNLEVCYIFSLPSHFIRILFSLPIWNPHQKMSRNDVCNANWWVWVKYVKRKIFSSSSFNPPSWRNPSVLIIIIFIVTNDDIVYSAEQCMTMCQNHRQCGYYKYVTEGQFLTGDDKAIWDFGICIKVAKKRIRNI